MVRVKGTVVVGDSCLLHVATGEGALTTPSPAWSFSSYLHVPSLLGVLGHFDIQFQALKKSGHFRQEKTINDSL